MVELLKEAGTNDDIEDVSKWIAVSAKVAKPCTVEEAAENEKADFEIGKGDARAFLDNPKTIVFKSRPTKPAAVMIQNSDESHVTLDALVEGVTQHNTTTVLQVLIARSDLGVVVKNRFFGIVTEKGIETIERESKSMARLYLVLKEPMAVVLQVSAEEHVKNVLNHVVEEEETFLLFSKWQAVVA